MAYCKDCIEKDLKIAELQETTQSLQAKLRYRERKEKEGPFGLSTPSSKMFFKETAPEEKTDKKGGAVFGHTGHGRASITEQTADLVIDRNAGDICPECGCVLISVKDTNQTVIDDTPREMKKILYRLHHKVCRHCKKKLQAKAPVLHQKPLRESYCCPMRRHALLQRHSHEENL